MDDRLPVQCSMEEQDMWVGILAILLLLALCHHFLLKLNESYSSMAFSNVICRLHRRGGGGFPSSFSGLEWFQ